jgi:alpha-L-arabinofuranosidase
MPERICRIRQPTGKACALMLILTAACSVPLTSVAQSNLTIYVDSLVNGWQNYSYGTILNFTNTSPVHSGSDSLSATITNAYGGIQLYHSPMTNSAYSYVTFWLNGGPSGGQQLQMYGDLGTGPTGQSARFSLSSPLVNTWQEYIVPLSALGVADETNFSGFVIQDSAGSTEPTFYVDDIQLVSATAPAVTHLAVNAGQTVRTADARWFGMNVAIWDNDLDSALTVTAFSNMGTRALRFPGGSDSDDYHWLPNQQDTTNIWSWTTSPASFVQLVTNANQQSVITVNYGTGFTNEAAAWVAYVNAVTNSTVPLGTDSLGFNWQTAGYWASLRAASKLGVDDGKNFLRISTKSPLGFKYWEIGNEVYGGWEMDSNSLPHDPYTYALRACNYISLMKAVDPTIHIGVVTTPGDDSYANYTNHPAVNLRTGESHYGWTPVLLATLKSKGVTPDFLIHHRYPQNAGGESDIGLLLSSSGWAADAATLRQEISDYFGSGGSAIELVCTENNSVSSNPGKQSVSLVAGLFMADSLAQLMQTELNGLFWWNYRNGGVVSTNNNSSSLYGWRLYGDYAVLEGTNNVATNFPPYYAAKLLKNFVQAGDTVISAASDYILLSTYAVRRQDGSLTMLTINKDPSNTANAQISLTGFVPASGGAISSYGIPQDNAAETGVGSPDVAQAALSGAGTNFNYSFPPYSATVLSLWPAPATLRAVSHPANAAQFVLQLQGQPGAPYIIERSTNLVAWTPVSTNTPTSSTMNITNPVSASVPKQFWRAVWQP